jgi:hypothetical protein
MCENMERTKGHPQRLLRCWRVQKTTNPKSKFLVVPPVPPSWLRLRAGWVLTAFYRPGPMCTAGRFVCGLKLKTAHWGSSIKMHGYVIGGHRSKLYGDSAFERFLVYYVPVSIDIPFPMGLWIQSANSTADRVPLTAQVQNKVWGSFGWTGTDSTNWTWDLTPGDREPQIVQSSDATTP